MRTWVNLFRYARARASVADMAILSRKVICDARGPCSAHASGDIPRATKCPGCCDVTGCFQPGPWELGDAPVTLPFRVDADWPLHLCREHIRLLVGR